MDKWRSEGSRARVDLSKLRSELEASQHANLVLRRDPKESRERFETTQTTAAEREAEAAKLHGQIAEVHGRFEERGDLLKEDTSESRGHAEGVWIVPATLDKAKDKLLEERDRVAEWNVKDAEKNKYLSVAEHA